MAAVTDEQLTAEMRAAAAVVMARVDELAAGGTYSAGQLVHRCLSEAVRHHCPHPLSAAGPSEWITAGATRIDGRRAS